MTVDLSAFYLDFAKDVVYIEAAKSLERRQMQTVFYDILVKITKLLTPILPHTAEEIWSYLEHEEEEFVQLSELPEAQIFPNQEEILDTWSAFHGLPQSSSGKPWKKPAMRRLSGNRWKHT